MNKLYIIGNLTNDPRLATTQSGISVCSFTVAVNNRRRNNQSNEQETQFFKVTAWRGLGENCGKFLAKGRKVAVVGPVELKSYTGQDGTQRYNMEITADDVEFLSAQNETHQRGDADDSGLTYTPPVPKTDEQSGFQQVDFGDDLPF